MPRLKKAVGPDFTPEGQTDSELATGDLLTWLVRERAARRHRDGFTAAVPLSDDTALEDFLRYLNALGDLNLLFSERRRLFCYHDEGG